MQVVHVVDLEAELDPTGHIVTVVDVQREPAGQSVHFEAAVYE